MVAGDLHPKMEFEEAFSGVSKVGGGREKDPRYALLLRGKRSVSLQQNLRSPFFSQGVLKLFYCMRGEGWSGEIHGSLFVSAQKL